MRHDVKGLVSDEELGTLYAFLFKNPGVSQAYPDVTKELTLSPMPSSGK